MLADSGPIARRAAQDALTNVGVKEDGPPYENEGKYVKVYLASVGLEEGYPWCSAFVSFRLRQAAREEGLTLPTGVPNTALAADWKSWGLRHLAFFRAGQHITQIGDLCVFDIASEGGIHHVGFVLSSDENGFTSVEGNTHPQGVVSRDGYCVAKRHHSFAELGASGGFVRLAF